MAPTGTDEAARLMERLDRMLKLPSSEFEDDAEDSGSSDSDDSDSSASDSADESSSELGQRLPVALGAATSVPPTATDAPVDGAVRSSRPASETTTASIHAAPIAPKTPGAGIHLSSAMRQFLSRNHSDTELALGAGAAPLPPQLLLRSESAEPLGLCTNDDGARLVVVHQDPSRAIAGDGGSAGATHPKELLRRLLGENGFTRTEPRPYRTLLDTFFLPVTPEMVAGYDAALLAAVRARNVGALRRRRDAGGSLQVCNRFHESVLHAAARRGGPEVVDYLLHTARLDPRVVCDGGRTPLHDACWTDRPDFAVVRWFLELCPDLLLVADQRNFTPLDYVPKESHAAWCAFLEQHRDLLRPHVVGQEV